ncbi:MAG: TMEM165/GDT1 family protein [Blastomonas sp.]
METLLTSTLIVALAEMGDKTQLLAIILATRFRKPLPIILGIFVATIANHALAALVGSEIAGLLESRAFRLAVAIGFIAMGLWTLIPDKMDDDDSGATRTRGGVFLTTLIAFFLVEMGDKTQIATIALGARYMDVGLVALGTTLGMMIANVPAVLLGQALIDRVPVTWLQRIAALLFMALGAWQLCETLGTP